MKKIVHVVGTGTIGEPLIGLFTDFGKHLGIDEVTFHKRTPMTTERAKVNHLLERGAKLAVDSDKIADFEALGHKVAYEAQAALERATVVIDCTPAGNENKKVYEKISGPQGFLAQGSEFGFGKMYAMGINDEALVPGQDRFLQIVSCNTHNISCLIKTLGTDDAGARILTQGPFRVHAPGQRRLAGLGLRAGALGRQARRPGVRHAPRARRLGAALDDRLEAADLLLGDEAEHAVHALPLVRHGAVGSRRRKEKALAKLRANRRIALTERRSANQIFSFGRDHGYYGRILSQAVISDADARGQRRQRDHRLLLHAAGRQLAGLLDPGGAVADGSGPEAARTSGCRCWTGSSSGRSEASAAPVTN